MKYKAHFLFLVFFLVLSGFCQGVSGQQRTVYVHSHNDYRQPVPFFQAYSQQVYSIEADIYTGRTPDELLVAHDKEELDVAPTLDELYLEPLVFLFKQNRGRPWRNSEKKLQLLIDLKTPVDPTLGILISKLEKYPEVFDPAVNPYAVQIVISGNRPTPEQFADYPDFIFFDGLITLDYTEEQLERVPLISEHYWQYATWSGQGEIPSADKEALTRVISKAHQQGKPVRFWGAPDHLNMWNTLSVLGADFINTDQPEVCSAYFRSR